MRERERQRERRKRKALVSKRTSQLEIRATERDVKKETEIAKK